MKQLSTLNDFSAGLNTKDAANLIPDNAIPDLENAVIGRGYVSKRYGYEQYASSPISSTLQWNAFGAKKWSEI